MRLQHTSHKLIVGLVEFVEEFVSLWEKRSLVWAHWRNLSNDLPFTNWREGDSL
jgi:hypothetical protein